MARPGNLWRKAVVFGCISTLMLSEVPNVEAATYSPVFYYYHTDHLGSVNVLTDRSGQMVQHFEYTPFGVRAFQDNQNAFAVSDGYTGQTQDADTGLCYYGARYYDAQLGRFIQPDPIIANMDDPQSINPYSYVRNNPLNETDPTGLQDGGDGGGDGSFDGGGGDDFSGSGDGGGISFDPGLTVDASIDWSTSTSLGATFTAHLPITIPEISSPAYSGPLFGDAGVGQLPAYNFDTAGFPATPTPNVAPAGGHKISVLSVVSAGLGILSIVPVIGGFASIAQGGIELAQGNYVSAGIAFGGAALAFVGAGAAVEAVQVARIAREAAEVKSVVEAGASTVEEAKVVGGAYKDIEAGLGEVHHMPADSVSTLSRNEGPAIWMEKADHLQTASHGTQGAAGAEYRAQQAALIEEGKFDEAVQMDINDIRSKFGNKYDVGIEQMLKYYKSVPEWKLRLQ